MQTGNESPYRYRGVPLTPAIIEELIVELLSGRLATRQTIVEEVQRAHAARGGKSNNSINLQSSVKKALKNLSEKGIAENPSRGHWRITPTVSGSPSLASSPFNEDEILDASIISEEPDVSLNPIDSDIVIGSGEGAVYLYYLPLYRGMADKEGEKIWPCKIGRTDRDPLARVIAQAGTALPEKPRVGLVVRTRYPIDMEKALHSVLTIRGKRIDSSPGTEWFLTSPDEVLSLVKFFDPKLLEDQSNTDEAERS